MRQVRVWDEGTTEALQDCSEHTGWNLFREVATVHRHVNVEEHATTVSAHIQTCMEGVHGFKNIGVRADEKPWMISEVRRY